jgi:hypothetical protein
VAKLISNGPPCASCAGALERARRNVAAYLDEIAAMAGAAPTYAEYRRAAALTASDAEAWLRRELDGLGKEGA